MKLEDKVDRVYNTILNKLSDVCEWELDGDYIIEDKYDFHTTHTELMCRVISKMYINFNLSK